MAPKWVMMGKAKVGVYDRYNRYMIKGFHAYHLEKMERWEAMDMSDLTKILLTCLGFILILWLLFVGIRHLMGQNKGYSSRNLVGWFTGLFIIGAVPLAFAFYTSITDEHLDANIGLGLAMLFAWAYCALLLCGVLGVWGRYWWRGKRR
ncbi:hypothetical protein [Paenibacillus amylolyticus]|uniref:hypothetical protein n=1 Tax=Paenibacillus amylolyticus TaxID=1451 RepID=UPI003EBC5EEC